MRTSIITLSIALLATIFCPAAMAATPEYAGGATDKAVADSLIAMRLDAGTSVLHTAPPVVDVKRLVAIGDSGTFVLPGKRYGVQTLRSDVYVTLGADRKPRFVYDATTKARAGMTLSNLLLQALPAGKRWVTLHHYMYGGKVPCFSLPLGAALDIIAGSGKQVTAYCAVTKSPADKLHAIVIYHDKALNVLHMLDVTTTPADLMSDTGDFTALLNTNIPMSYLKSIWGISK